MISHRPFSPAMPSLANPRSSKPHKAKNAVPFATPMYVPFKDPALAVDVNINDAMAETSTSILNVIFFACITIPPLVKVECKSFGCCGHVLSSYDRFRYPHLLI